LEFSYSRLGTDALIGAAISAATCGYGGTTAIKASLAANEGSKLVAKEVVKEVGKKASDELLRNCAKQTYLVFQKEGFNALTKEGYKFAT